ncbi:MAG: electron transfer flavoprotein subunit beta/FixA family protein [Anaerolineae bacterium]
MIKIVVTVKQILDPTGFTVNRRRERIFVNREEYIINPADLNALELALRARDGNNAVEVIAVGLGPARLDDALREVIARGADWAVHISDPALADLKTDAAGAARLIAAAVEKIGDVRLVMCGTAALDSGAGELPGRLAEALGWPMLAEVYAIEEISEELLRCSQRPVRCEVSLPALVTVPRHANQPRHIFGVRAMNAYRQNQVALWGLDDLGVSPADLEPLTCVSGRRFPPERALGTRLEGSLDEMVASLVRQLRARELI